MLGVDEMSDIVGEKQRNRGSEQRQGMLSEFRLILRQPCRGTYLCQFFPAPSQDRRLLESLEALKDLLRTRKSAPSFNGAMESRDLCCATFVYPRRQHVLFGKVGQTTLCGRRLFITELTKHYKAS